MPYSNLLTLFRIDIFTAAHGWGEPFVSSDKNLSHVSYNDETWHNYKLPKENPKNI